MHRCRATLRPARSLSYSSFGPGPITPAVKWILIVNVTMFVISLAAPGDLGFLGLIPEQVIRHGWIWQLGTYMFLHDPTTSPTSCSTCWVSGCSASSSSGLGHAVFLVLLRRHRARRRPDDAAGLAAAVRVDARRLYVGDRRRVRRALRPPARVRALLPGPADPDHAAHPGPGPGVRDDLRRNRTAQLVPPRPRHRRRRPPRRPGGRLPVPPGRRGGAASPPRSNTAT